MKYYQESLQLSNPSLLFLMFGHFPHYNYLQHSPPPQPKVWTKLICAGPSKVVEMPSHSGTVLLRTVNYATGGKVGSKITGEVTLEAQHICCNTISNGIIQSNLKEGFSHQFLVGHIYMLFG